MKSELQVKEKNRYDVISIVTAFRYLTMLAVELKKPIAILVPIGSNIGSHTGIGIVDDYINVLSRPVGIVLQQVLEMKEILIHIQKEE